MSLRVACVAVVSDPHQLTYFLTAQPLCALEIAFLVSANVVCYIQGYMGTMGAYGVGG